MSEEYKINIPLFEPNELATFDNHIHEIIEEYSKLMFKEKDQILTQRIIMKQEEEIERLNQYIDFYKDLGEKQNKELQNLKQINKEHQRINGELRVENDRLNNIVNEGKIYCEDVIQEHENGEYNVSTTQLAIEEHKKNIISLLNILNGDLENYWIR